MKQQWGEERRKLLGENATLKDATSRLNAEVRQAKNEVRRFGDTERTKIGIQGVSSQIYFSLVIWPHFCAAGGREGKANDRGTRRSA